tara:strand:- start:499 stop:720 length:222 start_codon:yes stop_codon:yes gene_type:complete
MKNQKFHERLDLINEAKHKITRMKSKNVFVLDVDAMNLLERLSEELRSMLSENLLLQENNTILSAKRKTRRDK